MRASLLRPGNFPQSGAGKLCALPCSDQEQASGLQSSGRMYQSKFKRFAGSFAAAGDFLQQPVAGGINFGNTSLDGVVFLEDVGNQRVSFVRCERLGFKTDLHDGFFHD